MSRKIHRIADNAQYLDDGAVPRGYTKHDEVASFAPTTPDVKAAPAFQDFVSALYINERWTLGQRFEGESQRFGISERLSFTKMLRRPLDDAFKVRLGGGGQAHSPSAHTIAST